MNSLFSVNNLKKVNKVKFNDFTEYVAGKSTNGGCYGYTTTYERVDENTFVKWFSSTTGCCPCCGMPWASHEEGDGTYSCGEFKKVNTEELVKLVNEFVNEFAETDDKYISFEEEEEEEEEVDLFSIFGY